MSHFDTDSTLFAALCPAQCDLKKTCKTQIMYLFKELLLVLFGQAKKYMKGTVITMLLHVIIKNGNDLLWVINFITYRYVLLFIYQFFFAKLHDFIDIWDTPIQDFKHLAFPCDVFNLPS